MLVDYTFTILCHAFHHNLPPLALFFPFLPSILPSFVPPIIPLTCIPPLLLLCPFLALAFFTPCFTHPFTAFSLPNYSFVLPLYLGLSDSIYRPIYCDSFLLLIDNISIHYRESYMTKSNKENGESAIHGDLQLLPL